MNSAIDRIFTKVTPPYLAFWARRVLRAHNPRVVGITGSVGKTTTKEMIAAALMHPDALAIVGRVWKTPGNMNNNVGLPLTVLGYEGWAESAVGWLTLLASVPFRALRLVRSLGNIASVSSPLGDSIKAAGAMATTLSAARSPACGCLRLLVRVPCRARYSG